MKYIIIRNKKSDKFTMHATTCQVPQKHYADMKANYDALVADAPDTVAQCLADMATYAEECGWNACPEVKICNCAK